MRIKELFIPVILTLLTAGCGIARNAQDTSKTTVKNDSCWHIDITSMNTMRYGSQIVTSDFFLELRHDTLNSYLPYMGQAFRSNYGETDGALNFKQKVLNMKISRPKQKLRRYEIDVRRRQETIHFVIELWDSGRAYINTRMNDRDPISYDGIVDDDE